MLCTQEIKMSLNKAHEALAASKAQQINSVNFDWNDMSFSASSESNGIIKLSAKLGLLYFTVEDERLRNESIKKLYERNRVIDGKFTLERDGSVTFSSVTSLTSIASGDDFIKAVTMIMLESGEHFKTLRTFLKAS